MWYPILIKNERNQRFGRQFSETSALCSTGSGYANYADSHSKYLLRNKHRRSKFTSSQSLTFNQELFQDYFLPEISHFADSYPILSVHVPRFPGEIADLCYDELSVEAFIPAAPNPSLSEYPEVGINQNSKLCQAIMRNISDFNEIREVHYNIVSHLDQAPKEALPKLGTIDKPSFKPTWAKKDLPPLALNSQSSYHVLKRSIALLFAHEGFECLML